MKWKQWIALLISALVFTPALALAEEAPAGFHLDGAAFMDSLQYMLKGLVGIFLVTGLIILVLVILEKATKGKRE